MLAHSLAINPSRAARCPVTSRASSAPLGLVSSLAFSRGRKESVKLFINVDRYCILCFFWPHQLSAKDFFSLCSGKSYCDPSCRYTKYSTPFCYAPRNTRITPLATASFGDTADSSTPIFPRIHVKDPYQRLGISREASEEEIRAARNFLINKYAGHKPSVDAIESAHDRIIMQSFSDRKKPKVDLKKKYRELTQSRPVKAIQGRFQTPSSKVIWQTAITFVLLGVLTLVFPTEEGPTLQVAISCAANIYFIYQRLKSGWRTFFYGFGSFFASWFLATFLMVSVIPPILPGPRNLEVSTACVTYALLFVSSAFLK
ncbi:hypothetical protein OsI_10801 [Oryza sativa Indica Group]|uniref:Uncharacterized protein n=1 Tax=Oryza sativa subsp. indica TaxID=39946 RepID=B8AKA7_ORYSI|nr:hypothetical protein OsI_10801 [Oryza sativa Indica Group]